MTKRFRFAARDSKLDKSLGHFSACLAANLPLRPRALGTVFVRQSSWGESNLVHTMPLMVQYEMRKLDESVHTDISISSASGIEHREIHYMSHVFSILGYIWSLQ